MHSFLSHLPSFILSTLFTPLTLTNADSTELEWNTPWYDSLEEEWIPNTRHNDTDTNIHGPFSEDIAFPVTLENTWLLPTAETHVLFESEYNQLSMSMTLLMGCSVDSNEGLTVDISLSGDTVYNVFKSTSDFVFETMNPFSSLCTNSVTESDNLYISDLNVVFNYTTQHMMQNGREIILKISSNFDSDITDEQWGLTDVSMHVYGLAPTKEPTMRPTEIPTLPTFEPSPMPTEPSIEPTKTPSRSPTVSWPPTMIPSSSPSNQPSVEPTYWPTDVPTTPLPSEYPTIRPTVNPTKRPTTWPTDIPTIRPSNYPTVTPSDGPTTQPSLPPTDIDGNTNGGNGGDGDDDDNTDNGTDGSTDGNTDGTQGGEGTNGNGGDDGNNGTGDDDGDDNDNNGNDNSGDNGNDNGTDGSDTDTQDDSGNGSNGNGNGNGNGSDTQDDTEDGTGNGSDNGDDNGNGDNNTQDDTQDNGNNGGDNGSGSNDDDNGSNGSNDGDDNSGNNGSGDNGGDDSGNDGNNNNGDNGNNDDNTDNGDNNDDGNDGNNGNNGDSGNDDNDGNNGDDDGGNNGGDTSGNNDNGNGSGSSTGQDSNEETTESPVDVGAGPTQAAFRTRRNKTQEDVGLVVGMSIMGAILGCCLVLGVFLYWKKKHDKESAIALQKVYTKQKTLSISTRSKDTEIAMAGVITAAAKVLRGVGKGDNNGNNNNNNTSLRQQSDISITPQTSSRGSSKTNVNYTGHSQQSSGGDILVFANENNDEKEIVYVTPGCDTYDIDIEYDDDQSGHDDNDNSNDGNQTDPMDNIDNMDKSNNDDDNISQSSQGEIDQIRSDVMANMGLVRVEDIKGGNNNKKEKPVKIESDEQRRKRLMAEMGGQVAGLVIERKQSQSGNEMSDKEIDIDDEKEMKNDNKKKEDFGIILGDSNVVNKMVVDNIVSEMNDEANGIDVDNDDNDDYITTLGKFTKQGEGSISKNNNNNTHLRAFSNGSLEGQNGSLDDIEYGVDVLEMGSHGESRDAPSEEDNNNNNQYTSTPGDNVV